MEEEIYHVTNKSIAGFKIFNSDADYIRMKSALRHYGQDNPKMSLSQFVILSPEAKKEYLSKIQKMNRIVRIIAYCIMQTHLHVILQPITAGGISIFISNVLNSYTRYFNLKHNRKGPLWEGPSVKVLIKTDEQFLHGMRYVHLNPVTEHLVEKPENWPYSSYREHIFLTAPEENICDFKGLLTLNAEEYRKFVENGISYQRELGNIKRRLKLVNHHDLTGRGGW